MLIKHRITTSSCVIKTGWKISICNQHGNSHTVLAHENNNMINFIFIIGGSYWLFCKWKKKISSAMTTAILLPTLQGPSVINKEQIKGGVSFNGSLYIKQNYLISKVNYNLLLKKWFFFLYYINSYIYKITSKHNLKNL